MPSPALAPLPLAPPAEPAAPVGGTTRHLSRPPSSRGRPATRTIIETAACPPELKRGERPWSFADFRVQRMLGEGTMSSVLACVDMRSGTAVVIKMYHKDRMNSMNVKQVSREIELHASLLHPNIVKLYAAFEDPDGIYLAEELAAMGDLYGDLSRRGGHMTEAHVAKSVLQPFLSALAYMHSVGVLHRDIKPENIMLGAGGEIKLGDFGLAINTFKEKPMSRVGTLDYMPPEIVRLPHGGSRVPAVPPAGAADGAPPPDPTPNYSLPADIWCVGVLAYELLVGGPPFEAETKDSTYTRILKTEPHIPAHLHEHARDFIAQTLRKDPGQRPTVGQLLRHPWLRSFQRPRSMHVIDASSLRSGSLTGADSPAAAACGEAMDTAAAAAAAVAAAMAEAAAPGGTASPRGVPAGSAPTFGRAISFGSPLTGRFTPKPTKPSALNQLALRANSGSAHSSAAGSAVGAGGADTFSGSSDDGDTIRAVGAQSSRGKVGGGERLSPGSPGGKVVVHLEARAGVSAAPAAAAAAPAPVQAASAERPSSGGPFAAFRRKLSSKSLAASAAAATASAASATEPRASGRSMRHDSLANASAEDADAGRLSGVQSMLAPSMAELLAGQSGAPGKASGTRRPSSKLLASFGRKLSLGKRLSGSFGGGGSSIKSNGRSTSRLSGVQGSLPSLQ